MSLFCYEKDNYDAHDVYLKSMNIQCHLITAIALTELKGEMRRETFPSLVHVNELVGIL